MNWGEGAFDVCLLIGCRCNGGVNGDISLSGTVAVGRNNALGFWEAGGLILEMLRAFLASERSKRVDDDGIELLPDMLSLEKATSERF